MSSWSPRSEGDGADERGQAEPIAALVAVLAIAIGLGLYAGVAVEQSPRSSENATSAEATMQRITAGMLEDGVVHDDGLPDRFARPGDGVRVEIEWRGGGKTIYGPEPPPDADVATRPVSYRPLPGEQYTTTVTVWVWES